MKSNVPRPQLAIVRSVIVETEETKSFVLEVEGGRLEFVPGQFVNVTADITGNGRVRRAYSMASSPLDPHLELTVKKMQGGILSSWLCDAVKPGDVLQIRGPYGIFTLSDDAKDVVFIAAGSGIVPFRSMWRYIVQRPLDTRMVLLYASKSLPFVIYRQELDELSRRYPVRHTLTRNTDPNWHGYSRRIDKQMLVEVAGEFTGKLVYVCGPPAMCDCVVGILRELNVPRTMIKTEKYD